MTPEQVKLVMEGGPLITYTIQNHYTGVPVDREDLRSIGKLGLIKAALTFDPEKGEWRNHAIYRIRSEIQHWVRDNTNKKRMPEQPNVPLDGVVPGTDGATFSDIIADEGSEPLDQLCIREGYADLHLAVSRLDFFTNQCVFRYYWGGHSQDRIAADLGVPQIRVSRAIRAARSLLKVWLESGDL